MAMRMQAAAELRAATIPEAAIAAKEAVSAAAAAVEAATEAVAAATEAIVTVAETVAEGGAVALAAAAPGGPRRSAEAGAHAGAPAAGGAGAGKERSGPRKKLQRLFLPQRARPARTAGAWPLLGLGIVAVLAAASLPDGGLPDADADAWMPAAGAPDDHAAPWAQPPDGADPCDAAYRASIGDVPFGLGPKLDAEMTARVDRLFEEHDAILAEYGFAYEEPELTREQRALLLDELDAAAERHAGLLDELDALLDKRNAAARTGFFEYSVAEAAVHLMIQGEQDGILRAHGFVIEEPELSASDERRLSDRLDAVWEKIDAVYEEYRLLAERQARDAGCPSTHAAAHFFGMHGGIDEAAAAEIDAKMAALVAEYEAILAEYGMAGGEVSAGLQGPHAPPSWMDGLTGEQIDEANSRLAEIDDRQIRAFEDLASRLAPLLANGSITPAEVLEQDEAFRAQAEAEYDALLAELGIGAGPYPALSAEEEDALAERLEDVLGRIDAVYREHLAPPGAMAGAAPGEPAG